MESTNETATSPRKPRGRPFVSGDPRGRAGPGRPARSEEERRAAAAEKAQKEVWRIAKEQLAGDLTALLKGGIPSAINALASIVEDEKQDAAVRVSAARELLDRAVGKSVQQSNIAVADVTPMVDRDELKRRLDALNHAGLVQHVGVAAALKQEDIFA